jgi:hypothetical protein
MTATNVCWVWCYRGTGTIWTSRGDDGQMIGGHVTVNCDGQGWAGQITCASH